MEPWQEAVRGEPLPSVAFALEGLERLRGWGRLWRPTPMFHLFGIRINQVVSGSVVASIPVTPWLAHPDGVIDIGLLADTVCGIAADTVVKARSMIVPLHADYRPLRIVRDDCRTLVGRASVVRTSPDWAYVEGHVEDGEGRAVAHVSMHAAVHPVAFPVPDQVPPLEPVDVASYSTPDPYRRPVPPEKYAVVERFHEQGCVETFRAIADGDAALPPLYSLLGIYPARADRGTVVTELATSAWLRSVDPADVALPFLRAQAVSTGAAAIWTITPPGMQPAIFDFNMAFAGSAPADGRRLTASATAERLGNDMVYATVQVADGDRRLATGSVSALLRPQRARQGGPRTRSLTTVLFTDVVASTATVGRLGDAAWRGLLERHHVLARSRIGEHGGREVKSTGDGFLATFDAPTAAVECACAIAEDVRALGVEVRADLHTGEVEIVGGDVAGLTVHVAARIEGVAGPGEVWVSDTVRALATGSGFDFEDRGLYALKGIEGQMRLHRVER